MISDVSLKYKQTISCKNKNYWIEAMNIELQNLYDNKIMIFKGKFQRE